MRAVTPANRRLGVAVGCVVFGCAFSPCHRDSRYAIRFRSVVGAHVWCALVSPWIANHHLGVRFVAVRLEWDIPWHGGFLVSGGSAVFFGTC